MIFKTKNPLESLSGEWKQHMYPDETYEIGFRKAFKIIDENLAKELNRLEQYPHHGERIMTLKLYKGRIAGILVEMEKNYE